MKLKLTVDGKLYEVDVDVAEPEQPRPSYVPPLSQTRIPAAPPTGAVSLSSARETAADECKVCRSPISGVVVRVSAQLGQTIQMNDVLMILEAMKMETAIASPIAGKIAKVNASAGDAVQGGQILIEFE